MSAKLTSQRRISPHEGQEGGSIGSASAAASFGWRNGSASPGEGVDSCRQRSQIGNPGLNLTLVGQSDGAASGPSLLGVALDLRNNPPAGHLLIGIAGAAASATATLTQPSPLGGDVALDASAQGGAQAEALLSAAVALTGRCDGNSVTPSSVLTGVLTLQAHSAGESSNRARVIRNRLFNVQSAGQASGSAGLTV